jgi:hypothetical protein
MPDTVKSAWFAVIHGIVPTNDRLATIHLTDSNYCPRCGEQDFIQHKINECGEGRLVRSWTLASLWIILRKGPRHTPPDWTIKPAFHYWPRKN